MLRLSDPVCNHCRLPLGAQRLLRDDETESAYDAPEFVAGFCSSACYHAYGLKMLDLARARGMEIARAAARRQRDPPGFSRDASRVSSTWRPIVRYRRPT